MGMRARNRTGLRWIARSFAHETQGSTSTSRTLTRQAIDGGSRNTDVAPSAKWRTMAAIRSRSHNSRQYLPSWQQYFDPSHLARVPQPIPSGPSEYPSYTQTRQAGQQSSSQKQARSLPNDMLPYGRPEPSGSYSYSSYIGHPTGQVGSPHVYQVAATGPSMPPRVLVRRHSPPPSVLPALSMGR